MTSAAVVLALCRFGQDAAALGLWGAWGFLAWLVPRDLAGPVASRLRRWDAAAVAVLVLATAVKLPAVVASIGEGWREAIDPVMVAGVLGGTSDGQAWSVEAAAAVLVLIGLGAPARMRGPATALAAAGLLAGLSLTGHAVMGDGLPGALHRAVDVLHVLSAGAWLGALGPVLAILALLDEAGWRAEAMTALRRFSRAGHVAVALVLSSGAAEALLVLGRWPVDLASPYEALLDAKVLAVAGMTGLAVFNRYVLVPRLPGDPEAALAALRRTTLAEVPLGLCAVALVAVFGLLDPGEAAVSGRPVGQNDQPVTLPPGTAARAP